MPPVIFLLNGPRRTGKDTAATAMVRGRPRWLIKPLAEHMKLETLAAHGQPAELLPIFEEIKDTPCDLFFGLSWREAVITYANTKRAEHGEHYFNKRWEEDVRLQFDLGLADCVVMSDCRFQREIDSALAITEHVCLYRFYRTEKMHKDPDAWIGDIGSWLFPLVYDVPQVSVINTGTVDKLERFVTTVSLHYYCNVNGTTAI